MHKDVNRGKRLRSRLLFGLFEWTLALPLMAASGWLLAAATVELVQKWSLSGQFPDPRNFITMLVLAYLVWLGYQLAEGMHDKVMERLKLQPDTLDQVIIKEVAAH